MWRGSGGFAAHPIRVLLQQRGIAGWCHWSLLHGTDSKILDQAKSVPLIDAKLDIYFEHAIWPFMICHKAGLMQRIFLNSAIKVHLMPMRPHWSNKRIC